MKYVEYAENPPKFIVNMLQSIQGKNDYIFMRDMDAKGDKSLCITEVKRRTIEKYSSVIALENIQIVRETIESWYYAGITNEILIQYKMPNLTDSQYLDKRQFISMMPKKFTSKTLFLIEILTNFSSEIAQNKNASFAYLVAKLQHTL